MTTGQFQRLRSALLMFFQDAHVRVSVFLSENVQTQTGKFILGKNRTLPSGIDAPGSIRLYKPDGSWLRTKAFKPGATFGKIPKEPAYGIYGDRVIKLGLNMYEDGVKGANDDNSISVDNSTPGAVASVEASLGVKKPQFDTVMSSELDKMEIDKIAAKELDILQSLLGQMSATGDAKFTINLDLFGKSDK